MYCPKCNVEFNHEFNPMQHGTHAEYKCPCGQLLQWDFPVSSSSKSGKITSGPPRPCEHEEFKKPDALMPIF